MTDDQCRSLVKNFSVMVINKRHHSTNQTKKLTQSKSQNLISLLEKPVISSNSKILADKKRAKDSRSPMNINNLLKLKNENQNASIHDRLYLDMFLANNKKESATQVRAAEQMQSCVFSPNEERSKLT